MRQKTIEQKYAKIISRKNTDYYAHKKTFFNFIILLFIGISLGAIVYNFTYQDRDKNIFFIVDYFKSCKNKNISLLDLFSLIFDFSKSDIRILFFVFISGFTYFCLLASGIMIVSGGFLVGFTSLFLLEGCSIPDNNITALPLMFFIIKLLIYFIITYMGTTSYMFSYKFREIKSTGSILRRASITYKYLFIFIYSLGGILITNFFYIYFLFNFIK